MTADPRRVVEVLELAAEMLAEGASPSCILAAAVRRMGLEPLLGPDDEETEGTRTWGAALKAERAIRGSVGTGPSADRRADLRAAATTLRRHILAVSLFCAGLAGWLDATAAALIAQHAAGDEGALATLLDLAEERGLDGSGTWERVEVAWLEAREHEHTWLACDHHTVSYGDGYLVNGRCPCGAYESDVRRIDDPGRARTRLDDHDDGNAPDPTAYAGSIGYGQAADDHHQQRADEVRRMGRT